MRTKYLSPPVVRDVQKAFFDRIEARQKQIHPTDAPRHAAPGRIWFDSSASSEIA